MPIMHSNLTHVSNASPSLVFLLTLLKLIFSLLDLVILFASLQTVLNSFCEKKGYK